MIGVFLYCTQHSELNFFNSFRKSTAPYMKLGGINFQKRLNALSSICMYECLLNVLRKIARPVFHDLINITNSSMKLSWAPITCSYICVPLIYLYVFKTASYFISRCSDFLIPRKSVQRESIIVDGVSE